MLEDDQLPPGHTGLPCNTSSSSPLLEAWLGQTIWSHPVRGRTHAGPEDWVTASSFIQLGRVVLEGRELSWSHLGSALSSLSALLPQPQSPQILNVE